MPISIILVLRHVLSLILTTCISLNRKTIDSGSIDMVDNLNCFNIISIRKKN